MTLAYVLIAIVVLATLAIAMAYFLSEHDMITQKELDKINAERKKKGVPALTMKQASAACKGAPASASPSSDFDWSTFLILHVATQSGSSGDSSSYSPPSYDSGGYSGGIDSSSFDTGSGASGGGDY